MKQSLSGPGPTLIFSKNKDHKVPKEQVDISQPHVTTLNKSVTGLQPCAVIDEDHLKQLPNRSYHTKIFVRESLTA